VLGQDIEASQQLTDAVEAGLPAASLTTLAATLRPVVDKSAIYALVGQARTLQRKQRDGSPMTRDESLRLTRIAGIVAHAQEALGEPVRAHRWLMQPNRALEGCRPFDLLGSAAGADAVADILLRIEHGVLG
jgi:putative toxin-antitoxin system antitoxin component (TIGR02293 family)